MKKFFIYFLLLNSFIFVNLFSSDLPEGVTIVSKNKNILRLNFNLPTVSKNFHRVGGQNYLELNIENYGCHLQPGYPFLPTATINVMTPYYNENIRVKILSRKTNTETVSNKIYPVQIPWEKTKSIIDRPFYINQEIYKTNKFINSDFVTQNESFIINGTRGLQLNINPFSYNPVTNQLLITESAEIEIEFSETPEPIVNHSIVFQEFLSSVLVNYNPKAKLGGLNYLIITAPEYENTLSSFVSFKQSRGYSVNVFNTNITGSTLQSIKNFIQNKYNNPETRPDFVLLVGDVEKIPSWTGVGTGNPRTDLNYSLLEGTDYYADVFIGRFSISSIAELQNAINKTIFMEANAYQIPKKSAFMASTDRYQVTEGGHNYCINNFFVPNGYTQNLKLYTYTYSATTEQLIAALNNNQKFAIYSGHGSTTSWADGPPLNQTQVRALTNTIFPFVYSFACVTGQFENTECFGETWLRTSNGGVTFYGSSVNSYWTEDSILQVGVFRGMFVDNIKRVTPMFNKGKVFLSNYYGFTSMIIRYYEMYNLMGDPSIGVEQMVPPDSTPPLAVTNLSTANPTSNSITLLWTAPYDSTSGGVTSYDIRYSTIPITNDSIFNISPRKIYDGNSDSAGTPKSYVVKGLNFNTTYYFAIKARDMFNNASPLSETVSGTTYDAPKLSVKPDSLKRIVRPNKVIIDSVIIKNITNYNSTLDYSVALKNNTYPQKVEMKVVPVNDNNPITESKDNFNEKGGQSIKGNGGPDAFGYKWIDSDAPNGPVYEWNDISTTGTLINNWVPLGSGNALDDGRSEAINMGMNFKFYGQIKTQVYVVTNGFLSFDLPSGSLFVTNPQLPTTSPSYNIISPFWDDLDGRTQGTVHYKSEPNKFTVQFTNWQKYSAQGSFTFQIVLYASGKIMIYYNNMNGTLNSASVGIQNNTGIGLGVAYNSTYIKNNLALMFAAIPEWLSTQATSGTLYNGNSAKIELRFESADYALGDYSMDLEINSNDPLNSQKLVKIRMIIDTSMNILSWFSDIAVKRNDTLLQALTLGQSNFATDSIDAMLGELQLPPPPPLETFDVRFKLPTSTPVFSLKDFRNDNLTNISWIIQIQPGSVGLPLVFQWDKKSFPNGSFRLKDMINGTIVNVNMKEQGSYTLNTPGINSLKIEYSNQMMLNTSVKQGWNIVGVPLMMDNMSVQHIFPNASSSAYYYNNGYLIADTLHSGRGYWIKFDSTYQMQMSGYSWNKNQINLIAGWNLISVFDKDLEVSNLTTTPDGILASPFYGFENTYQQATQLKSGRGYWIRSLQQGVINIPNTMIQNKTQNLSSLEIKPSWGKLLITDALNRSINLYLTNDRIKSDNYQLPPTPPNGIFDVRFLDNTFVADLNSKNDLVVNSAVYPIRIKAENCIVKIKDVVTGEKINYLLKNGNELTISDPNLNILSLEPFAIPINYSLNQNYPNPFNPTTVISYDLPTANFVKLTIMDVLGRVVETLINQPQDAGKYTIEWNAAKYSSGIYYYELKARDLSEGNGKEFRAIKKMLLIK